MDEPCFPPSQRRSQAAGRRTRRACTEVSPPPLDDGSVVGEVFIADRLENGAGYATWLAKNLESLITAAKEVAKDFVEHAANGCDGSCYDCLRDYSNSAYHPLLDWFLAKEALGLLTGVSLDLVGDPWTSAIESYASAFKWSVVDERPGARVLPEQPRRQGSACRSSLVGNGQRPCRRVDVLGDEPRPVAALRSRADMRSRDDQGWSRAKRGLDACRAWAHRKPWSRDGSPPASGGTAHGRTDVRDRLIPGCWNHSNRWRTSATPWSASRV